MNSSSVKTTARKLLVGKYGVLIAASIFVELITLGIGNLFFSPQGGKSTYLIIILSSIVISLLTGILDGGLHLLYLKAADEEQCRLSDLFFYFKNSPDRFILIALFIFILDVVLTFPYGFLVPPNISYWIMPFPVYGYELTESFPLFVRIFLTAAWTIICITFRLRFIFAYYIAVDHADASAKDIILECLKMTRGNILRILWLLISFIGFLILGLFSLGIAYLWIIPYMRMSVTVLYQSINEQNQQ